MVTKEHFPYKFSSYMLASYENIPCARDSVTSSTIMMVIILMLKRDASEFLTHS